MITSNINNRAEEIVFLDKIKKKLLEKLLIVLIFALGKAVERTVPAEGAFDLGERCKYKSQITDVTWVVVGEMKQHIKQIKKEKNKQNILQIFFTLWEECV